MLQEWITGGSLPNLATVYNQGVFGRLETTIPTQSAPAWSSLYTGTNPGKHGVYGFVDARRKLVSSTTISGRKLWQVLSDAGLRCCVINAPLTYPPEEINGYMISSWLSPTHENRRYTYPLSLVDRLENEGYKLYPDLIERFEKSSYGRPPPEQMFQHREAMLLEYYEILEIKEKVTLDLLSEETWDLFFWVITETDAVQHLFYDRKEVLRKFFQRVDRTIGTLLKVFYEKEKEGYVVLVSDHGFGPTPLKCVNLQALLPKRSSRGGISRFWRIAYRLKPIVDQLYSILPSVMKPILRKSPPPIRIRSAGIYIQKNRFTHETYNALRTDMIYVLKNLKDENGCPVFRRVWRKEELYDGPHLEGAPDIAYLPREEFTISLLPETTELFHKHVDPLPGKHHAHPFGTLMMQGPEITPCHIQARIVDILPPFFTF